MTNAQAIPTVFTTSGFVVPLTPYHTPYADVNGIGEPIFAKAFASSSDQMLREYFKYSHIYISETGKKLYDAYTTEPSIDNFIAVVDMVTDVFKTITPEMFFQWQAGSKHISSSSMMFCKDLVSGKFLTNYNTYNVLGFNSRFAINNGVTSQEASANWRDIDKCLSVYVNQKNSWVKLLTPLMGNRAAFMTFFKHIFVDFF